MATDPTELVADLDRELADIGQDVILRKSNTATGQVTVKGRVRFYRPEEIAGIIRQGDSKVVISPTGLSSFGVPPPNGYVVVDGIPRMIIVPNPIKAQGVLVRIDLQVRGG